MNCANGTILPAFENIKGGYEVRNPYYKGCIKGKDISVIRYNRDVIQRHVCVFEGLWISSLI